MHSISITANCTAEEMDSILPPEEHAGEYSLYASDGLGGDPQVTLIVVAAVFELIRTVRIITLALLQKGKTVKINDGGRQIECASPADLERVLSAIDRNSRDSAGLDSPTAAISHRSEIEAAD